MSTKPQRKFQEPKQQLDLSKASTMNCEACGNYLFIQSTIIKKISAIMSPNGQEIIAPVQVFNCGNCGTMLPLSKELDELI